ncbi:26S proteasome regulatory subunit rpn2, partial [Reticulomyxa filosa]
MQWDKAKHQLMTMRITIITKTDNPSEMIDHCFNLCETVVTSKIFRGEVLVELAKLYEQQNSVNYSNLCRCYFYLGQPQEISRVLWALCQKKEQEGLALQVAFDLAEYQNERFQRAIFDHIPKPPRSQRPEDVITTVPKKPISGDANASANANVTAGNEGEGGAEAQPPSQGQDQGQGQVKEEEEREPWAEELLKRWDKLRSILLGIGVIPLELDFLFRNNHSDLLVLKQMKEAISERDSVKNNALVCCNGLMHSGTTIDQFLRDNLEWMSRSAHWAKFTSVATLGMIHRHHIKSSMTILERYLPGSGGGPYQEGGSLEYLLEQLIQASNEILQHGSCLGLALAALGSQEERFMTAVKDILYNDRA